MDLFNLTNRTQIHKVYKKDKNFLSFKPEFSNLVAN